MKYIAYYRVSTKQQGASGLGLEAQKAIVLNFVKSPDVLSAEFTEIESGTKSNRPQLAEAIAEAKNKAAVLIVAKLDRLSRNVRFLAELMESKVAFKCCDLPECDNFTIHLFAALAQKEAELISSRTKAALAAKKAQGVKLGSPKGFKPEDIAKGSAAMKAKKASNENNRRAAAFAVSLRSNGASWSAIALQMNAAGFKTAKGKQFQAVQVQRLLMS